ncbi:MAG: signal peptidase I [Planctomycetota bacterium]
MTTADVGPVPVAGTAAAKKKPLMGPVRVQLEAFGVAILGAVLMKWLCLEAFQIPTSSMQPTLMGSNEAGVYDRILVDKLLPAIREPKRWDITVFKYPLQKNQNYVKRLGGMPNDRLTIGGGNLWQVSDGEGGKRTYQIERKPADLQEQMWKNVFPGRMHARSETKCLGQVLGTSPPRAFSEDENGITAELDGRALLFFRDEADGGMVDRVWDGYPEEVARAIREKTPHDQPQEIVPDVRIAATVTAAQTLDELAFEIEVARPNFETWTYALMIKGGKANLQVRAKDKVLGHSEESTLTIAPGSAVEIAFAHVDAELVAWRDGRELLRFKSDDWECRDGCVLPYSPGKLQFPANQKVTPQIVARGKGRLHLGELRIDRDQHYVRSGAPEIIEVPDGHYYMLGDNTLQSVDSRGWTAVTIGVDADDNVVPPDTPGARVVRGNKRPMSLANPPDRDETPIPIPGEKALVMIDEYGEILRLKATVSSTWPRVAFSPPNPQDGRGEWEAPDTTNTKGISFVPRADIQGRAVMIFYPARPFAWLSGNAWPGRFGFVR